MVAFIEAVYRARVILAGDLGTLVLFLLMLAVFELVDRKDW